MAIRRKSRNPADSRRPTARLSTTAVQQNLERLNRMTSPAPLTSSTLPPGTSADASYQPTSFSSMPQRDLRAVGEILGTELSSSPSSEFVDSEQILTEAGEQRLHAIETAQQEAASALLSGRANSYQLVLEAQQAAQRAVANAVSQTEVSLAALQNPTRNPPPLHVQPTSTISTSGGTLRAEEALAEAYKQSLHSVEIANQGIASALSNKKPDTERLVQEAQQAAQRAVANAVSQVDTALAVPESATAGEKISQMN